MLLLPVWISCKYVLYVFICYMIHIHIITYESYIICTHTYRYDHINIHVHIYIYVYSINILCSRWNTFGHLNKQCTFVIPLQENATLGFSVANESEEASPAGRKLEIGKLGCFFCSTWHPDFGFDLWHWLLEFSTVINYLSVAHLHEISALTAEVAVVLCPCCPPR